jgi:threonyl-tRNA synthetase
MIPSGTPNKFPEGKLADEPPVEDGFYYDFDLPRRLTPQGREAARTVFNP